MTYRSALLLSGILLASATFANDADALWRKVTELDAGPRVAPKTQAEARQAAVTHMSEQERTLRAFVSQYGNDPRSFEARIRLSRVLQIRADFERSEKLRAEAKQWLDSAEKIARPEQRVEVNFSRVTYLMRAQRASGAVNSQALLDAVRHFQKQHPDDSRLPALMVEVSTLFDAQPRTKRSLLSDARALTADEDLRARIADDLKRLDLLGADLPLSFTSVQGQTVDIAKLRGKAVVVVFFADWSPPSTAAMQRVKQASARYSRDQLAVLGISLDQTPQAAMQVLKSVEVNWPTACDGKGWMSPIVRGFGINALPTVWLVDQQGKLRSLNAVESITGQLRQIIPGR